LVHVVCPPPDDPVAADAVPDLTRLSAFLLRGSDAVCMRRGYWHANFPLPDRTAYVIVSRKSTTLDIVDASRSATAPTESLLAQVALVDPVVRDRAGVAL